MRNTEQLPAAQERSVRPWLMEFFAFDPPFLLDVCVSLACVRLPQSREFDYTARRAGTNGEAVKSDEKRDKRNRRRVGEWVRERRGGGRGASIV